ncbi:MAG: neutral zinc metallopeptidase [Pseudonocardiaceae bacterium]
MHSPRPSTPVRRNTPLIVLLALLLGTGVLTVGGCAITVSRSSPSGEDVIIAPADTSVLRGTDGGPIDELAAATVLDVQSYWRTTFERTFGMPWRDLSGGFYSVDTSDPQASPPPCLEMSAQLRGNAFYCADTDAIAWDRAVLLPALRERYGDGGVVVVLAHEVGHAVHNRLGIDPALEQRQPGRYPTVLTEAMADCYAGSFVRWVAEGNAEHLRLDEERLDLALSALVTFRDPVGIAAEDIQAHGNAFDRVSAFQDGYQEGPQRCADFSVANRTFTQERFATVDDLRRGGNLRFADLVRSIIPDLDAYFAGLVTARGGQWQPPQLRPDQQSLECTGKQGPAAFCPAAIGSTDVDTLELDTSGQLPELHAEIGDYSTGTLLASRYSLAALDALGLPTEGESARRGVLCLAGTYTGTLLQRTDSFGLSPGDLDEAVQVLLGFDYVSRDISGRGLASGFARVEEFRAGTLDGVAACDL